VTGLEHPTPARWEHYEHDADIGVRGYGATRAQAFEQAALALTAVVTDPTLIVIRDRITDRVRSAR
jgi:SHS2 domain-containing protein